MNHDKIIIKGAREHNLKNINVEIPRDKLTVITGLSGSGKSTLAFDTIYAEGQRRYVESLSAYARQFLGLMDKPDVDYIEGLSPAISIEQKTTSKNPRSTVGTVTEIYDYFRLLFARVGIPHCPECGQEIQSQTVDQIVDNVLLLPEGTKIQVLAPIIRGKKGEHQKLLESAKRDGYVRVRINGEVIDLSEEITLDKKKKHNIEVVIDRLVIKSEIQKRLAESIEASMKLSGGLVLIDVVDGEEMRFSKNFACPDCNISIDEIEPRLFSFNSPFGACPDCTGLGFRIEIDPELIIENPNLTLLEGAIHAPGFNNISTEKSYNRDMIERVGKHLKVDLNKPFKDLSQDIKDKILYGTKGEHIKFGYGYAGDFHGVIPTIYRRYKETTSDFMKEEYEKYMSNRVCDTCKGARLKREALAVKVNDKNISEITGMAIRDVGSFFEGLKMTERSTIIADMILKEIKARLGFLIDVGLDYLTLSRASGTLSGGEAQRIRLATQIGSGLMGVIYILDEPSVGLHQRDNGKLIKTLKNLRDMGNTLIIVEHDEDTMLDADHIIDIGPGAGAHGGEVICEGNADTIKKCAFSETGMYLSGKKKIEIPKTRRKPDGRFLNIIGAEENNLKNIDVDIPLGIFTCVTGLSGSGKSSLINEILFKHLSKELNGSREKAGKHKEIKGIEHLDKVIDIDQSPIGRTPRSNPATYTGVFDFIRDLFTNTVESKMRGYQKGRFSFNVNGGRCEACHGDGIVKIEMHFLPDVYVPCEVCHGKRYNRETLEVKYKGKSISEVLDMTVEEALKFFENVPQVERKMRTLFDVGLSYIKIGQPSTTLSGGEAQRIKLATELSKRSTGKTMYILDEPTTGLHFEDINKLITILQRLVGDGNTVLVIEHNLDVIKTADYIIDLGPEGGDKGGLVVACGTPEKVAKAKGSYTGEFLKKMLK
ncbi:MAG TPA: excinuclease ABC subunit UvrA [Clostridiales bacterium]|nr:MAG: excinuclease ABC subunit A [Clostridiales bacterium GWD2_32_19]HCC08077.1 excinuclease ABC subunit UvrA [Clostridiales bacterium]